MYFPEIPYPYYWRVEVGEQRLYLGIKKRPFGLFKNAISWTTHDSLPHSGMLTEGLIQMMQERAEKVAEQLNPRKDLLNALRRVPTNVPVQLKKY